MYRKAAVPSVAGLATCNSLRDSLRDPPLSKDSFIRQLKTFLFSNYSLCIQRVRYYVCRRAIQIDIYLITHLHPAVFKITRCRTGSQYMQCIESVGCGHGVQILVINQLRSNVIG